MKAVNDIDEPWNTSNIGRPPHEPRVVAVMCTVKIMNQRTYESTESYGRNNAYLKQLLGMDKLPTQSVIHRGMKKLSKRYIRKLNKRITVRFRRKGISVALDATGFKLRTSSLWYDIRIKRKGRRKDFTKLHIVGCVDTGIIHNYTITAGRKHDSPQLKELISVIDRIIKAVGDSAYLSRRNCKLVAERGGKPYFRLKCNVTAKPKSHPEWKAMIKLYWKDPDSWLKKYHIRSFIESVFCSIKKRFGNFLRLIRKPMQEKELALKVICYNVIRVLYVKTAKELGIPLWVKA